MALALEDHREVHGIPLPFRLKVLEDVRDLGRGMHCMGIETIRWGAAVPAIGVAPVGAGDGDAAD